MPTQYADQFFTMDPANPPPVGSTLTFQRFNFTDQDDDGEIGSNTGDTFNGFAVTNVWENDTVTINVPGVGNVTYTGVTFYLGGGQPAVFTPTDGQVLQDGTFVSSTFVTVATETPVSDFGPTCFTPGTWIRTPRGERRVEHLRVGDLVDTLDHGAQPVRMVLDRTFPAEATFAPIHFDKGAIGNTGPLLVSPQHRMLIRGWQAELFYGQDEVLVAAKHLVNGTTVRQQTGGQVRYIHLLFDDHQLVWGQGVLSESCYPTHAVATAAGAHRDELLLLFPELARHARAAAPVARPVLAGHEAALLAA